MTFVRNFMLVVGPVSSAVRLPHLLRPAARLPRRRGALPHRLVRRVARHPGAGDLRHPHPRQPPCAAARSRSSPLTSLAVVASVALLLPFTPARPLARLRGAAGPLLPRPRRHGRALPGRRRGGEALVLPADDGRARALLNTASAETGRIPGDAPGAPSRSAAGVRRLRVSRSGIGSPMMRPPALHPSSTALVLIDLQRCIGPGVS